MRACAGIVLVLFGFFASGSVEASTFTTDALIFNSTNQSIWGPGGAASFNKSGFLLGNNTTGIRYSSSASTGAVSSRVTGQLQATYADGVKLSSADSVAIGLDFLSGASSFESDLGANIRIAGELIGLVNNFTIFDRDYGLNIDEDFESETPATATGDDDFSPAAVSLDLPGFGVGLSGTAGVALDIQQDATLRTLGLTGMLLARHVPSGTTRSLAFALDQLAAQVLFLNLSLPGLWEIELANLGLLGDYTSLISGEFNPFIGGGYGVFCGDPFDPDDNFLCVDEGGVKTTEFIGVDLFDTPVIPLAYNTIGSGGGFQLFVTPEPGTISLLLVFASAILVRGRRPRS